MDDKGLDMILKNLKTYFNTTLLGYYPATEIDSFFYMLAEAVLGMKRIDVSLELNASIEAATYNHFQEAAERLQSYEPIQYILGDTEFYGLLFKVNSSVLIPRPETEELVSWIIEENKTKEGISILDIGTGSGCIAITLAKHLPKAKVFALDVSRSALEVAKKNAVLNAVDVHFIEADILKLNAENKNQKPWDLGFDVVVSNPPYVRELEKELMTANVLKHEPHLALFVSDDDALIFYRKITQFSKQRLNAKGQLFFEINEYLGKETKLLMENEGFKAITLEQDVFDKDRMIKGELI